MIGTTVSHYRILEHLGQGGMGEVYLAEDTRLNRPVALKMLRGGQERDQRAFADLLYEARAASSLNHPNIAVIYEVDQAPGEDGMLSFIAMEFVAGETLAQYARREAPGLDAVLELVTQIAQALAAAHERGVVHRDVKPGNVMVGEGLRVKVLDFGLARRLSPPDGTTLAWVDGGDRRAAGTLLGTVLYMSPEQALGREVDARSDIYSLGAVFYELLAGHPPFAGESAAEVFDGLLHREPPPLPAGGDPRLERVEPILRRMLARDRNARYADLAEMLRDLDAVRRNAEAAPQGPVPVATPSVAVLGFANITRNPEDDWLGTGLAETVTADMKQIPGLAVVSHDRIQEALRRLGSPAGEADERLAVRVGQQLGARWVLSGGFQRVGESVRVTARLGEAATGTVLRTVKADGRFSEIFALQDRIAGELAAGLRAGLRVPRAEEETKVLAAYEALSKGLLNLRAETYESLDRAILLFERAAALDPTYARAYVELGAAYATKADYLASPELLERALEPLRRAIELRPDAARPWREMGMTLMSLGRDEEGLANIERALALAPDDPTVLAGKARALFLARADFAQAAALFERALERNPHAGWYWLQLSHCYALRRDLQRGEAAARRAIELQEAFLSGREGAHVIGASMRLGHLAALGGRHAEAVGHLQRELAFQQRVEHALRSRITIELHMRLGAAQLALGNRDEAGAELAIALDAFERRVGMGADDPYTRFYAAGAQALRGDAGRAIDSLEKAAKVRRAFTLERAKIEPEFDGLRGDPRFAELLGGA
ncbi:MAG TPA: protein kinase [Thermoanaerobaculia bacterium]|nr:protein kinase [Thermoanaerobaculia bacterium]